MKKFNIISIIVICLWYFWTTGKGQDNPCQNGRWTLINTKGEFNGRHENAFIN